MGKIARMRAIENVSAALLNVYKLHGSQSEIAKEKQTEILVAFKIQYQAEGKSKHTINDWLSCGLVRALETYKKLPDSK